MGKEVESLIDNLKNTRQETAERIKELLIASVNALDPMPTFTVKTHPVVREGRTVKEGGTFVEEQGILVSNGYYMNTYLEDEPGVVLTKEGLFVYPGGRGHGFGNFGDDRKFISYISEYYWNQREPATLEEYLKHGKAAESALNRVKQERVAV